MVGSGVEVAIGVDGTGDVVVVGEGDVSSGEGIGSAVGAVTGVTITVQVSPVVREVHV